jgi:hypothetical protein
MACPPNGGNAHWEGAQGGTIDPFSLSALGCLSVRLSHSVAACSLSMQWRRRERGKEMVVLGLVMGTGAGFVHPGFPRIRLFSDGQLALIEPMAQLRRPTPSKRN